MRKKLLLIAGGVLILTLAIVLVSALTKTAGQKSFNSTSDSFMNNVLSYKDQETYAQLSKTGRETYTQNDWMALVTQLSTFFSGSTPVRQSSVDVDKTDKTTTYSIAGDNTAYTITIKWSLQNGKWMVNYLSSLPDSN